MKPSVHLARWDSSSKTRQNDRLKLFDIYQRLTIGSLRACEKLCKRSVEFVYPPRPPGRKTGRGMVTKAVGLAF